MKVGVEKGIKIKFVAYAVLPDFILSYILVYFWLSNASARKRSWNGNVVSRPVFLGYLRLMHIVGH